MKHVILALTATVILASVSQCDAAARFRRQSAAQQQVPAPQSGPAPQAGAVQQGARSPGFFGRLMELERRKNERLRQMFFGR